MAFLGPLLGAGAGLFGGLLNNIFAGERQEDAQEFNAAQAALSAQQNAIQADANRSFTNQQAGAAREWQQGMYDKALGDTERFSNTSWQRSVADMRAAGINPILAASKGGASSPTFSGGSSSGGSAGGSISSPASSGIAQTFDIVAPAIASAKAVQEVQNLQAQERKTEAETLSELNRPENIKAGTSLLRAQKPKVEAETDTERQMPRLRSEQSQLTALEGAHRSATMPVSRAAGVKASHEEELWRSPAGKVLAIGGAGGQSVGQILAPVTGLMGTFTDLMAKRAAVQMGRANSAQRIREFDWRKNMEGSRFEQDFGHWPGSF